MLRELLAHVAAHGDVCAEQRVQEEQHEGRVEEELHVLGDDEGDVAVVVRPARGGGGGAVARGRGGGAVRVPVEVEAMRGFGRGDGAGAPFELCDCAVVVAPAWWGGVVAGAAGAAAEGELGGGGGGGGGGGEDVRVGKVGHVEGRAARGCGGDFAELRGWRGGRVGVGGLWEEEALGVGGCQDGWVGGGGTEVGVCAWRGRAIG